MAKVQLYDVLEAFLVIAAIMTSQTAFRGDPLDDVTDSL